MSTPNRPRPAQTIKALPWDALLSLSEEDIVSLFPLGADETSSGKWMPAGETPTEEHKSLKQLIQAKRKRAERPRYLGRKGGYTSNPVYALRTDPEVGEPIPEAMQREYAEKGWEDTSDRKAAIPLSDQLADIEDHLRPEQRAELKRRIEGLKRSVDKAA